MSGRLLRASTPAFFATAVAAAGWRLVAPESAEAHGLVSRGDLPLPEWLLIWGAALLLIGSFAALVLAWRRPILEAERRRPLPAALSRGFTSPIVQVVLGTLSVGLLVLVVYSGLQGTAAPDRNFSVTFVFVTFWLGLVLASVLFGDVFRALSPWRAIGRAVSALFAAVAGQRAPAPLAYPEWLGRWPAVAGLVGFLWLELVWGQTGFAAAGVSPHDVAVATIVYSAITFVGMGLFGVDRWSERGETFSVYFGMFASLSGFELRDGRICLRPPLTGATRWAVLPGSLAVMIVAIAGTSFDGASEGLLTEPIRSLFETFTDAGISPVGAMRLSHSLFLLLAVVNVSVVFAVGIVGMRMVGTSRTAAELGRLFAHAFIPIALGYLLAHYFSLLVFQEQAQFTYLLSDPLGDGSDIFGTADNAIDYSAIGATAIQWVQFGSIVVGHAVALALGHDRALKLFGTSREAAWSQVWMLVVMVIFSTQGLYLLTQANA